MEHEYTTTKIWRETIAILRHIHAETGESHVAILHRLTQQEWQRIRKEIEMTSIVAQARELAQALFNGKVRRESGKSVFEAHLEPVARLVERYNGDGIAIAAAYLHDAIEDIGVETIPLIEALSPEVLAIVQELTEEGTGSGEKPPREVRHRGYLARVPSFSPRALLISECDKAVSGEDFAREFKQGKFGKGPEFTLEFYDGLIAAYGERGIVLYRQGDITEYESKVQDGVIEDVVDALEKMRYYYYKYKEA